MRPLRVSMQAFGPFAGRQVVDFRELGDDRFFLIHGPTGSGKTTILDAMCFALYGVTSGAERTAEQMRSQYADPGTPTEVVFDFRIGEDSYRVRRAPKQERPKARGAGTTTQLTEATLWRRAPGIADTEDGTPLETKVGGVDAALERIIGFRADQFRQVVMIPQGRFRDLLSASSGDREKIMQTLFATGLYASIEIRLKERKREVEDALAAVVTRREELLGTVGTRTVEELAASVAECEQGCEAAERAAGAARAAADDAASRLESGRSAARCVEQETAAIAAVAVAEDAVAVASAAARAAAAALEAQEARKSERDAAAVRVHELEAMASVCAELAGADRAVRAAAGSRDAAAKSAQDAEQALGAVRVELASARVRAGAGEGAAAAEVAAASVLDSARAALELARRAADLDREVEAATKAREAAVAASTTARAAARAAAGDRDELIVRWREGRAAALAETLLPGTPCPVCGATDHPAPAHAETAPPSDDEVAAAEKAVREASEAATGADAALAQADSYLASLAGQRAAIGVGEGSGTEAAEAAVHNAEAEHARAALHADQTREAAGLIGRLEAQEAAASVVSAEAAKALVEAEKGLASASAALESAAKRVPDDLRAPGVLTSALDEARAAHSELTSSLEAARAAAAGRSGDLAAATATRDERVLRLNEARAAAKGAIVPDIIALEAAFEEAAASRDAAIAEHARLAGDLDRRRSVRDRLAELDAENADLLAHHRTIASISDAANGRNPRNLSFQRYVLGVFMTDVLAAATTRLAIMTGGRYRLHLAPAVKGRGASGLDLEVFDEYTGEDRPVGTLSGGEGFLASLALALGLAEVVEGFAGGVHLDTVFIDEGFGTLDEEALDTSIDALMELRGAGRLVGIISHVTELQKVIPARLEVTATPQGSTARFVVP